MSARLAPLLLLVSLGLGCGTKEDAVLSVYTQDLVLTKGTNPFGAKLEGSVRVVFDMGHYATGSTQVTTITLALSRGDATLLPSARFVPDAGEPTLPITVAAGEKKSIRYLIRGSSPTEPLQLSDAEAKELCAGQVAIKGTVGQAGMSTVTVVGSTPITPTGCP